MSRQNVQCPFCPLTPRTDILINHLASKHVRECMEAMSMRAKQKQKNNKNPIVYCDDTNGIGLFAFCLQCRKGPRWSCSPEKRSNHAIEFQTTHTECKIHWTKFAHMFDLGETRSLKQLKVKEAPTKEKSDSPDTRNTFVSGGSEMSKSLRSSLKRWYYRQEGGKPDTYESEEEEYDEESCINKLLKEPDEDKTDVESLKAELEKLKDKIAEARNIVLGSSIRHTEEGHELLERLPVLW